MSLNTSTTPSTPLATALDKSTQIQELIEKSADELLLVNTVLKTQLPADVHMGDVAQALEINADLEERIQQSAVDLAQVNDALEHEIEERHRLEGALKTAQKALAVAQLAQ